MEFHISIWGARSFGGDKPTKAPRGNGTDCASYNRALMLMLSTTSVIHFRRQIVSLTLKVD